MVGGFFLLLSLAGTLSFKSYGLSWDEPGQRLNGGTSLIYVAEKFAPSLIPADKLTFPKLGEGGPVDHGVAFDAPLVVLERIMGLQDPADIYHMHHFVNFAVLTSRTSFMQSIMLSSSLTQGVMIEISIYLLTKVGSSNLQV